MKLEDLSPEETYLCTLPNGVQAEVRVVKQLPPQSMSVAGGTTHPGTGDMRHRCRVEVIQTGWQWDVWLDDLAESSN